MNVKHDVTTNSASSSLPALGQSDRTTTRLSDVFWKRLSVLESENWSQDARGCELICVSANRPALVTAAAFGQTLDLELRLDKQTFRWCVTERYGVLTQPGPGRPGIHFKALCSFPGFFSRL